MGNHTNKLLIVSQDQLPTSFPPSGSAGGDLSGTYPNPIVSKLLGNSIPINANGYLLNDGSGNLSWNMVSGGGVTSFNTRTGAITLTSGDVTTALGYTPYNATNPSGYITSAALTSYVPYTGATSDLNLSTHNLYVNNYFAGGTSTISASGTTILTVSSTKSQVLTGTLSQIFQLPDATTISNIGEAYFFNNNSSGSLIITNNAGGTLYTILAGGFVVAYLTNNSTTNGIWDFHIQAPSTVTWSSGISGLIMNTALTTSAQINSGAASSTVPVFIPQRGTSNNGYSGDSTNLYNIINGSSICTINSTGLTVTGTIIKSGGTSSQFLKADGSIDSSSYITNSITTLSSLVSIGTITTGIWNAGLITGTYGGTGVNNGSKTITLGANLTTTGIGAPTLAFSGTGRTYTFPDVATTVLGQTGTAAANYIPYFNDANQVTSSSNFQFQTFDAVNGGRGLYINSGSANNFILANYNLTQGYTILNSPQTTSGSHISMRFGNSADLVMLTSGTTNAFCLGPTTFMYLGNATGVPSAKLQIGSNLATSASSTGNLFSVLGATLSDAATAGTAAMYVTNAIGSNTMTASNARTYTDLANFYIAGVNTPSTNVTATRNMALWVGAGWSRFDGTATVNQTTAPTYTLDVGGDIGISIAGKGLRIKTGTNQMVGSSTLVGGTVTITNANVSTSSFILVTDTASGSLVNVGTLTVTKAAGSFTVTSTNALDTSTFDYFIINPY